MLELDRRFRIDFTTLDDARISQHHSDDLCIVLLELDRNFLYNLSEASYAALQRFISSVSNVLWVNLDGGSVAGDPALSMVRGLARSLRNEVHDLNMSILSLEEKSSLQQHQLNHIAKAMFRNHLQPRGDQDPEYLEINGVLHIPRVYAASDTTHEIMRRSQARVTESTALSTAPPIKLAIGTPGLLNTLHFVSDPDADLPLRDDEVEVQVQVFGVNADDVKAAPGHLPAAMLGQECTGTVARAGKATNLRRGDRVIVISSGLFRNLVRGHMANVFRVPDCMTTSNAAAILTQFGSAWAAVHHLAHLESGESILIHSAAEGTGQAMIQLAKRVGATIYATVETRHKKELLMRLYGIPSSNIFDINGSTFANELKHMTQGKGADVAVVSSNSDVLSATLECMASYGRLVEIGKREILANSTLPLYAFRNGLSFMSFDRPNWLQQKSTQARKDAEALLSLFAKKQLTLPQPFREFDVSQAEAAFRSLHEDEGMGKTVLTCSPSSRIEATLELRPSFTIAPNGTYVIAGGLGGIGRATARWLVERGARNLILLSRYGPRTPEARELVGELSLKGVRVETPACDVIDNAALKSVLDGLASSMPPIKGCMQMSVVSRDMALKDMDWESWRSAVECKTVGTNNLDALLPSGMDFFIILASASGLVGIHGQTNYNAGNTYEDALARRRVARGQKAVSLDLGAMLEDGILAENPALLKRVLKYGTLKPISRRKFYGILDYYCNPALPLQAVENSQVAIGIGIGGMGDLTSVDYSRQPMLLPLTSSIRHSGSADLGGASVKDLFCAAKTLDEASKVVADAVANKLAKSIEAISANSFDLHRPLQMYGVDSLLAIELRNWIVKDFSAEIAVFDTQGASTLATLSMLVARKSELSHSDWAR